MLRKLALCCAAPLALSACDERNDTPVPLPELAQVDEDAAYARSAEVAQSYQGKLKAKLVEALEAGGPMLAADVCHSAAPMIAAEESEASGAQVIRVADKNRSPNAALTEDMRPHYAQLAAAPVVDGQPAKTLWVSGEGAEARVHVMSAIPMQDKPCATCHGTDVDPALLARLQELYPGDQATGFAPGDMRGAMLISWPASAFGT